jgi:hypothetical protein
MQDNQRSGQRQRERYVNRFAGDAMVRANWSERGIGPEARKVAARVQWKIPPQSNPMAELSR